MQRSRYTEPMILVLAVLVPLAGVVLALLSYSRGERPFALRVAAATLLGVCLYALVFG